MWQAIFMLLSAESCTAFTLRVLQVFESDHRADVQCAEYVWKENSSKTVHAPWERFQDWMKSLVQSSALTVDKMLVIILIP